MDQGAVCTSTMKYHWGPFKVAAATAAKSLQSCLTLCDPVDGSTPGSPVPGILQARTRVGCHFLLQCMTVKSEREVAQSCPTLSDPMDFSPPSSSAHEVFQARVLEWGAITFQKLLSHYKSQCNVSMGTYTILIWERWEKICVCVNMGSWFSRIATFFPKICLFTCQYQYIIFLTRCFILFLIIK